MFSIASPEYRRVRKFLRWASFVLLVLGVGGAWIGLEETVGPETGWADLVFAEVQLMAGIWQPEAGEGQLWSLRIATVVVPLATTAFLFLFAVDLVNWLRGLARNHTILVGRGTAATAIRSRLRSKGMLLVARAGDRETLRDSGVRWAKAIVVVGDDTADTAMNLATTRTAVAGAKHQNFTAHVLVPDPGLALALRARRMVLPDNEDRRIRVFTVDELAARNHVRGVPLNGLTRPHLLVVGSDPFGRAVIVEFARRWSVEGDRANPPLVTLVADDAEHAVQEIRDRWPFAATTCELRALQAPVEEAMLAISQRPFRSYFCDRDEEHALRTALTAATRWRPEAGSIVVRLTRLANQPMEKAKDPSLFDDFGGALDVVPVYDAAAQEILRADEPLLVFARSIHQSYLDDALRRGEALGSRPSLVAWEQLPEDVRESNIAQAIAFPRTLSMIRCSVAPRSRLADPFFFRPGEVERLARSEHEQWVSDRREAGWARGKRNDRRKVHPLLVAWEELSEGDRSRNRAIVRARPLLFDRVLERDGLQIVRLAADPAATEPAATEPAWLTPETVAHLARLVHERYLAQRIAEGDTMDGRPSMRNWADLDEDFKEANRAQVRDIGAKLDVLEATVTATPPALPFEFAEDEIEMLARFEHERWVSQRIAAGWTYGPERDDAAKVHPLLVPWLYQSQQKREIDRQVVRGIPSLIEAAGWYISRR